MRINRKKLRRFLFWLYGGLFLLFAALIYPTLTVWKNSVPWLNFLSIMALVLGMLIAWQGVHTEMEAAGDKDDEDEEVGYSA